MALYLFITALVLCMGYFVNVSLHKKNIVRPVTALMTRQQLLNKVLLFGIFMVLFSVSALRIGIGNDYWEYRNGFLLIAGGDTPVSYEIGFKWVVLLMQRLFGLDNYRTTFALFSFLTCFFFIKGLYDNSEWFFYSLFLLMANGFYFMSFSNIRYYFVFAVVMYAFKYVLEKRYCAFVLWILFAALFHKTVLLVIPAYLIAYYLRWNKKTLWMIPAVCAVLFFGKKPIRWVLFKFYPFYEGDKILDTGSVSYMNMAKCGAILVLCLIFFKIVKDNKKAYMFFNLNLFALVLYVFGTYVPELSRICYYMVLGHVFLVPIVLMGIEDKKKRYIWTTLVTVAYVGYYFLFLWQGYNPYIMFLPYLTWLFT